MPSRARSGGAPRAGFHVLVEGVADLPRERPQHLFGGLARGDLLVIVGAAVGVPAADLGDRGLWMAWFSRRFPRSDSRQMMRLPEDTSAGAVPLSAAKQSGPGNREMSRTSPGTAAATAGPAPDTSVTVVPQARTAAASLHLVSRRGASRRRRPARNSPASSRRAAWTAPHGVVH